MFVGAWSKALWVCATEQALRQCSPRELEGEGREKCDLSCRDMERVRRAAADVWRAEAKGACSRAFLHCMPGLWRMVNLGSLGSSCWLPEQCVVELFESIHVVTFRALSETTTLDRGK